MKDIHKRGRFYTSRQSVMFGSAEFAEVLSRLSFVPLRVELLAHVDKFEYIGISPAFRALETGERIPKYTINLHHPDDGGDMSVYVTESTND